MLFAIVSPKHSPRLFLTYSEVVLVEELIGKYVKYIHPKSKFQRYGKVIDVGVRTLDKEGRITKTGKRVKRPTVGAVVVKDWDGSEVRVPVESILAVNYYGKDRPIGEWLNERNTTRPVCG